MHGKLSRACNEAFTLAQPFQPNLGDWLVRDEARKLSPDDIIYHLESEEDGRWLARAFHRALGAARLTCSKNDITELPQGPFAAVRIVRFTPIGLVQDYNPVEADSSDNLWIFGNGLVRDLGFDPKEWEWRKIGALKVGNFFSYETKKGY
jgi:hypothetical protein